MRQLSDIENKPKHEVVYIYIYFLARIKVELWRKCGVSVRLQTILTPVNRWTQIIFEPDYLSGVFFWIYSITLPCQVPGTQQIEKRKIVVVNILAEYCCQSQRKESGTNCESFVIQVWHAALTKMPPWQACKFVIVEADFKFTQTNLSCWIFMQWVTWNKI